MELLTQNMAESLLIAGLILLVIEVLVLGFSTFFLFFLGLSSICTGLIFFSGVIEENAINALISVSAISVLSAFLLWQPLKKMQSNVDNSPVDNDLIGYQFQLEETLNTNSFINHQYSGIIWKITSEQEIVSGRRVEVVEVGVGKMKVKAI